MNEVTKIHLGRQAFAISSEAHHELQNYLDAIKRRVHDEGVVNEVELRMAELLAERGVTGDKVILPTDVDFLKEQLGDPKDFADDDEANTPADKPTETKRLYRDTDNAMVAGVSAGLANYFVIDVLIVRLLFIVVMFAYGWGILLYIVLWLLVPEAKTSSDRLQMAGKPVTINGLKEMVDRADVKGAARRANRSLAGPVNTVFTALLRVIGIGFVVVGLALLLGIASGLTYVLLHTNTLSAGSVFPVGLKEHTVVYIGGAIVALLALFIVLFGMAIYRRKWPIHAWVTGILVGVLFVSIAVGSALTADIVPQVRDRYNANMHTTVRTVQPFTTVNLDNVGSQAVDIEYQTSNTYSVNLRYYANPNLKAVKTSVVNGVLTIDTRNFNPNRNCSDICIPNDYSLVITIDSPTPPQTTSPNVPQPLYPRTLLKVEDN